MEVPYQGFGNAHIYAKKTIVKSAAGVYVGVKVLLAHYTHALHSYTLA
jgi:hypothetical protein